MESYEKVATLYEIHETKKSLYYVMEYMAGGELFMRFKQRGFYNEKDAM